MYFWFTSEGNYNIQKPESILEPIWQTPKDDNYHRILEKGKVKVIKVIWEVRI